MRIIFTGATSLAGRQLWLRLREEGHDVVAVSRRDVPGALRVDLESARLTEELPAGDFDALVSFASYVPLDERASDWAECYARNVRPFGRLLHWAAGRVGRVLHASSCAVYGAEKVYVPTDEEHPVRPDTAYALSKYAQEQLLSAFARSEGVPAVMLRLGYVYGPGIDPGRAIAKLLETVRAGRPVTLTNSRTAGLHLIHVNDIARIGAALLAQGDGIYNLASPRLLSLRDYVEACGDVVGRSVEIMTHDDPDAPVTNHYSVRLLHERYGLRPAVSLREGIASIVESWATAGAAS